jgi:hypothetical protein
MEKMTEISTFNTNLLTFTPITKVKGASFSYDKMYVDYDIADAKKNRLIFEIPNSKCFGIKDFNGSKTLSVCLTEEQASFLDILAEKVSQHLVDNDRDCVKQPYYAPEDPEKSKTLAIKLHPNREKDGLQAGFYDAENDEEKQEEDLEKHFNVTAIVQLDSVYISKKCTKLSFSLLEALIHHHEEQPKRRFLPVKRKEA